LARTIQFIFKKLIEPQDILIGNKQGEPCKTRKGLEENVEKGEKFYENTSFVGEVYRNLSFQKLCFKK